MGGSVGSTLLEFGNAELAHWMREKGVYVPYEHVAMSLFQSDGTLGARIVCLCAEPGMGRRDVVTGILALAARNGARVFRRDLASSTQEEACTFLTRLARRVEQLGGSVVVGVDVIPPSDEAHVARQVRALRRVQAAGASVVVSVDPEGAQLVESMPECALIRGADLLVQAGVGAGSNSMTREVLRLSRGIPSLVSALVPETYRQDGPIALSASYLDALSGLVAASLRKTLIDEELRLRLAMLLLGRGSVDDLAGVIGSAPTDLLESLCTGAPLYGVSPDLRTFSCLTSVPGQAFAVCLRRMEVPCALFPEIPVAVVGALIARHDYGRAAAIGALPECSAASGLILEHGVEFVDAGEAELVGTLAASPALSDAPDATRVSGLLALLKEGPWSPEVADGVLAANNAAGRGLLAARLLLKGRTESPVPSECEGPLERTLAVHREACALMLSGRFTAATRLLVTGLDTTRGASVSGALLAVDDVVARLMTGGASATDDLDEACAVLRKRPLRGLSGYLAIAQVVRGVMAGGTRSADAAQAIAARAERSGELLVQAVALLGGCVTDLREGAYARAHVRSTLASSLAVTMGSGYLLRVAALLGEVAGFMTGAPAAPMVAEEPADDLDVVTALVREAFLIGEDPLAAARIPAEVPWDALWLLRILLRDMGVLSDLIAERVPARWRKAVTASAPEAPEPVGEGDGEPGASSGGVAPIELELLGGFTLRVRGVPVPDWKIERRNAKSVLEYLVLRHGSGTKRFRLVEQVWPDCDYVTGFNRAYQATSVLRSAIAEIDPGIDPFVTSRTSREISIDLGTVTCDVDEFRTCARDAADAEDAAEALGLARRAERLYVGDLYLPAADSTGFIAALRSELRNLYADAMVAGAEAALRLGRARTAVRLAREALAANDLREDAVKPLVRALRESGRSVEASREVRGYEARLARATGGRTRRRLATKAAGDGGSDDGKSGTK